jgi:transcriptional regulator with XRE-family HTH domain
MADWTLRIPRTRIERGAARAAERLRRTIGEEIRTLREDSGLSLSRLAGASGVSKSHLHEIEGGKVEASYEIVARIAAVLGATPSMRLFSGTGPLVRDHASASMIGALADLAAPRWHPQPEVRVHRPVSGVIDLVLGDEPRSVTVACEAYSELRRLEQQVRWSTMKADALAEARGAPVSRLLLLRSTARHRAIANEYASYLGAAYPARAADLYHALTGDAEWPGDGILWARVDGTRATILDRPPRGVTLGR